MANGGTERRKSCNDNVGIRGASTTLNRYAEGGVAARFGIIAGPRPGRADDGSPGKRERAGYGIGEGGVAVSPLAD